MKVPFRLRFYTANIWLLYMSYASVQMPPFARINGNSLPNTFISPDSLFISRSSSQSEICTFLLDDTLHSVHCSVADTNGKVSTLTIPSVGHSVCSKVRSPWCSRHALAIAMRWVVATLTQNTNGHSPQAASLFSLSSALVKFGWIPLTLRPLEPKRCRFGEWWCCNGIFARHQHVTLVNSIDGGVRVTVKP